MLKQNYFNFAIVYLCINHSNKLIKKNLNKVEKFF